MTITIYGLVRWNIIALLLRYFLFNMFFPLETIYKSDLVKISKNYFNSIIYHNLIY